MTRHRHYTGWPLVEGYCDRQSVRAGDRVHVHCSGRVDRVTIDVVRAGAEPARVWRAEGVTVGDEPVPDDAWASGCDWPIRATIDTEAAWPSGLYLVRFRAEGVEGPTAESHAFFVLRPGPGAEPNPIVLSIGTNTWNAYNQWGGRCLYSGADRVSFARPLERGYLHRPAAPDEVDFDGRVTNIAEPSDPDHQRLVEYQATNDYPLWTASAGWHNWERRFVVWAERAGFGLDYVTNADLDEGDLDGEGPVSIASGDHRLLVSVGHDEYWTWGMRDTVDRWVDGGGNLAVFGGNTSFWQVRYTDDGRTMVCHKGRARIDDPVAGTDDGHLLTSMWSDPLIGRPEPSTIGLTFTRGGYHRIGQAVPRGSGAYTVHRPEHWVLAGTDLRVGDQLGAGSFIVGYEVDGCAFTTVDGRPVPTGEDGAPAELEIVATAPARLISITDDVCEAPSALWASTEPPGDLEGVATMLFGDASAPNVERLARGHAVLGVIEGGGGRGTIVNVGSADWAYGLDRDPTVGRITANVLDRLSGPDEGAADRARR